MATPKQSFPNDEFAAKETISEVSKSRLFPTVVSGAVVTVENGNPSPDQVFVDRMGTVQFVNLDSIDYRLRLWTRSRELHPDVDVLLSGRGGVTVIVDEAIPPMGECYYELFPFEVSGLGSLAETMLAQNVAADEFSAVQSADVSAADTTATAADDSSNPRKAANKQKKGPGGGIITVP